MAEHELLVLASKMRRDQPPRGERVLGRVLAEVPEEGERLGAGLNLIEDDEGAALGHDLPRLELDGRDDAWDVLIRLELLSHLRVVIEVHVRDVLELRPAELFEQPRLARLSGAVQNERLTVGLALPLNELLHEKSLYVSPLKTATAFISHSNSLEVGC